MYMLKEYRLLPYFRQGNNMLSRRAFLKYTISATLALGLSSLFSSCDSNLNTKPNFIIILADDLGYGDIGCFGNKKIKTPNIDRLAREGMKFTDFHSNGAVCSPTRAALLTGRYQQRCGIQGVVSAANHRDKGMSLDEITFAEVLKPSGYTTGMFGKWHVGYPAQYNPVHQGFSDYVGFVSGNVDYHSHVDQQMYLDWWQGDRIENQPGYSTDLITDCGVKFIERNKEQPFCLYLAHGAPHYPYQGRNDPAMRKVGQKRTNEQVEDLDRRYKEMIEILDESVGKIVKTLKRLDLGTKTLIFFFSDNGPVKKVVDLFGSAGPLRGCKASLWEGGHRVPAIACWSGKIPAGSISHETGMGMDLFVTMASLAGAELPKDRVYDGIDLSPVLLENKKLRDRSLFWRFRNQKAVRRGPYKLIVQDDQKQLFKLDEDLAELKDISKQYPEKMEALLAELENWEKEVSKNVTIVAD